MTFGTQSFGTQLWQPLSRSDRHVRRASLRLPTGVSERRATFVVEEALRLMALPGEEQGRTYYFRRVALRGLVVTAPPGEWVDRAQSTMHALAVRALHGADVRAADADAVFFYNQEEALEWLLGRLFRIFPRTLHATEWFAQMISPVVPGADPVTQVVAVIERLRSLPAGWFAAATVFLDTIDAGSGAVSAMQAIPERVLRMWLNELGGSSVRATHVPRFSDSRRRMLLQHIASTHHATPNWSSIGSETDAVSVRDVQRERPAYLVLLATLVVVAEHPAEVARGSALACGEAVLEELCDSIDRETAQDRLERDQLSSLKQEAISTEVPNGEPANTQPEYVSGEHNKEDETGRHKADKGLNGSFPTNAGGLYFLLNVLRVLDIETALESLPATIRDTFVPKLIESLARASSVAKDDPALLWVTATLDSTFESQASNRMVSADLCWPRTLLAAPGIEVTLDRLIRVWTVAVRRWCWLNTRLTLREIVSRPARVLLTRTDLDVTLSMDTVDLRLRRVGLDLDPGWLPWFGRVVRFHYTIENAGGEAQ